MAKFRLRNKAALAQMIQDAVKQGGRMLVQHTRATGANESEIVTTSVQTSKIIFRHPKSRSGGRHHTNITQTRLLCSRFVWNCSSRMKPRLKPTSGSLHPFCSCRMSVSPLGASSSQASSTSHALVAPSPPSSTTIIHHITAAPSSAAALANTLKPPTHLPRLPCAESSNVFQVEECQVGGGASCCSAIAAPHCLRVRFAQAAREFREGAGDAFRLPL